MQERQVKEIVLTVQNAQFNQAMQNAIRLLNSMTDANNIAVNSLKAVSSAMAEAGKEASRLESGFNRVYQAAVIVQAVKTIFNAGKIANVLYSQGTVTHRIHRGGRFMSGTDGRLLAAA